MHLQIHTGAVQACAHTHTYPTAINPTQFHPTDIGILRKSKPIDNPLENYKRSIANFLELITPRTFNIHSAAGMCAPPAEIPIGSTKY